jgi:hypothetical protein
VLQIGIQAVALIPGIGPLVVTAAMAIDAASQGNWGQVARLAVGLVAQISTCGGSVILQGVVWAARVVTVGWAVTDVAQAAQRGDPYGVMQGLGNLAFGVSSFFRACFAAGTPLLTPDGDKLIERFEPGDLILTRDEGDPAGPLEVKAVEEVFVSTALILHVHVGGQVIRTTAEHPFYAYNKGWLAARELDVGDLLLSHDGQQVAVEDLLDKGEWETVYNLRVANYHTYFVGARDWCFSVWSHNLCEEMAQRANQRHTRYANDLSKINRTLQRLGQRALREARQGGRTDYRGRGSESRFRRYAMAVDNRLARTGSPYRLLTEPAAMPGTQRRVETRWGRGPDGYYPTPFSKRGSRRLDMGVIDTTRGAPRGLEPLVSGFDISQRPFGRKGSIVGYYQQAFGPIPIFDIRPRR